MFHRWHMGMVMNISCGIQLLTVFGGKEIERKKKKKATSKPGLGIDHMYLKNILFDNLSTPISVGQLKREKKGKKHIQLGQWMLIFKCICYNPTGSDKILLCTVLFLGPPYTPKCVLTIKMWIAPNVDSAKVLHTLFRDLWS